MSGERRRRRRGFGIESISCVFFLSFFPGDLNLRTIHDPAELHLRVQSTLRTVLRNAFAIAKPADRCAGRARDGSCCFSPFLFGLIALSVSLPGSLQSCHLPSAVVSVRSLLVDRVRLHSGGPGEPRRRRVQLPHGPQHHAWAAVAGQGRQQEQGQRQGQRQDHERGAARVSRAAVPGPPRAVDGRAAGKG